MLIAGFIVLAFSANLQAQTLSHEIAGAKSKIQAGRMKQVEASAQIVDNGIQAICAIEKRLPTDQELAALVKSEKESGTDVVISSLIYDASHSWCSGLVSIKHARGPESTSLQIPSDRQKAALSKRRK